MREIQPTISASDHLFHLIVAFFNRLTLQISWVSIPIFLMNQKEPLTYSIYRFLGTREKGYWI